ncbi:MAG TPA: flagellar hook-basal body complex protein [Sedimentisphaerales bacterium]|nr:flagellar hook-basal body complex protein [Sedimentisphaerales bacterium]
MSFALSAAVTGLQAHQKMLDIAGNNLANMSTTAFKASNITFSELLSETIKKASAPSSTIGGINPQQMGSGVGVAGISRNMSQGNIVNTGQPLDLAIEGEGYFVASDGQQDLYTRAGAFGVDAASQLVDPSTGFRVQRIGATGESDGFQTAGDSNINVPFDTALPARATSAITVSGNLSADGSLASPQTQLIVSNMAYTVNGSAASASTLLTGLDQFNGTLSSGVISFSGYKPDGTALSSASPPVNLTMPVTAATTLGGVLTWLNTNEGTPAVNEVQTISISGGVPTTGKFNLELNGEKTADIAWNATAAQVQLALENLPGVQVGDVSCTDGPLPGTAITVTFQGNLAGTDIEEMIVSDSTLDDGTASVAEATEGRAVQGVLGGDATASLLNGKIRITDTASGYSRSDITMSYSDATSTLTMPGYFEIASLGGEEVKPVNITLYDSQGGKHTLSGAFVRTDTPNEWNLVLTSISGNISEITMDNRRIDGISFDAADGSYMGLSGADTAQFVITFAHDTANPQTISVSLGTQGECDGLTQFAGTSTAVVRDQDGYESGRLTTVSVNNEGILIGAFSNGVKKDIATLKIALFQNATGLESIGNGYFISSANSGEAVATQALNGGAGAIHGGALEKSNADVASEFVNMILAQNGFQANARTIRVANDVLRELSNLIR